MADTVQPIIVKKVKGGGHAHHGGAWKVAYADFVTAMMAFFLLLWLLNATTEEQKRGIADYFTPAAVSASQSGSGGVLGGTVISLDGVLTANGGPSDGASTPEQPSDPADTVSDAEPVALDPTEMTEEQLAAEMARREQEQFEQAAETLRRTIDSIPELARLKNSLLIDQTPEGLRIQIADQEGTSMFPLGSSAPNESMQRLIGLVSAVVETLPNRISVSGHTDDLPYRATNGYSNWELSADRANAARRLLVGTGLVADRIALVQGRAATEPLLADDPASPRNRRISIVLLRETDAPLPDSSIFDSANPPPAAPENDAGLVPAGPARGAAAPAGSAG
jgi:chemotaxis protein MotB